MSAELEQAESTDITPTRRDDDTIETDEPQPQPTAPSRWRTAGTAVAGSFVQLRTAQGALLALCLLLCAAPTQLWPSTGIDPGWVTILNSARPLGLQFGRDIAYTYGPWGFLTVPLGLTRDGLLMAIVFSIGTYTFGWFAIRRTLSRCVSPLLAAVAATVLIVLVTPGSSTILVVAVTLTVMDFIAAPSGGAGRAWVPAVAAAAAALTLEIKFSEGVFLTLVAAIACVCAPNRIVRRVLEGAVAYVVTLVVAWLAAGQHIGNLPDWFRQSVDIAKGYTEAMAVEYGAVALGYVLIIAISAASLTMFVRTTWRLPVRASIGLFVAGFATMYLGFKEATGRHDGGHQVFFYVLALPVLMWLLAAGGSRVFRTSILIFVVLLAYNNGAYTNSSVAVDRWSQAVDALFRTSYAQAQLLQARAKAQETYGLSDEMVAALAGHPVAVDGFESSLPYVYGVTASLPPVFQSYVAYTHSLDELNADWLRRAPAGQLILRPTSTSIDYRNSLWDSPDYVLTEMCQYQVLLSDQKWLLLEKGTDRCGEPTAAGSRRVAAGESITLPAAGSDLITVSFTPDAPGVLRAVEHLLLKPRTPLFVTTDKGTYRLPRALANGQLVTSVPSAVGWPSEFGGGTDYRTVSFSMPGVVQISERSVD